MRGSTGCSTLYLLEGLVKRFEFRVALPDTPLVHHLGLYFKPYQAVLTGNLVLRELLSAFLGQSGSFDGGEEAVLAVGGQCSHTGGIPVKQWTLSAKEIKKAAKQTSYFLR